MAFHIDTGLFLALLLLFFMFIPHFHLLFIILVMSTNEWFNKLAEKIGKVISSIYDITIYIISNPIILTGLIIYLCMSVTRFTAI